MGEKFADECMQCFCPRYTLNEECHCGCHRALKMFMSVRGMTLEEAKAFFIKDFEYTEANPDEYDQWMEKHGQYGTKEDEKLK
jgi:hypothetical protein